VDDANTRVTPWKPPSAKIWTAKDGQAMLAAHRASGLNISRFLRHHGLTAQRYYYWRDQLAKNSPAPKVTIEAKPIRLRELRLIHERQPNSGALAQTNEPAQSVRASIGGLHFQIEAQTCSVALKKLIDAVLHFDREGGA
jgi:hypothetical protein